MATYNGGAAERLPLFLRRQLILRRRATLFGVLLGELADFTGEQGVTH